MTVNRMCQKCGSVIPPGSAMLVEITDPQDRRVVVRLCEDCGQIARRWCTTRVRPTVAALELAGAGGH